ncbi:MAG TPA: PepSY domain-containing protein [Candidatus Blautia stercoravium]|nr:PepSY domain-containing protein [Candidatus Blautia stercoravium]
MKKYTMITAVLLLGGLLAGCGAAEGKDIGQESAKSIAFEKAGVTEDEVSRLKVSKDRDDGRSIYEVEFDAGEKEYSYDIGASDGAILSAETDVRDSYETQANSGTQTNSGVQPTEGQDTANQQNTPDSSTQGDTQQSAGQNDKNQGAAQGTTQNVQVAVSQEDAKKAALERVPGAEEKDLRMELDLDDGQYIYEGDIVYQQTEYEFEIDANTGSFLKWSEEKY